MQSLRLVVITSSRPASRALLAVLSAVSLAAVLNGCSVRDFDEAPSPFSGADVFASRPAATELVELAPDTPWWDGIGDPKLAELIERGLSGGWDVAQAYARLVRASTFVTQARAGRLPQLDGSLSAGHDRNVDGDSETSLLAALLLRWDIDLFGNLGASVAARSFEARSAAEQLENVRLALSAAIAEAYFNAVEQRQQLKLLREQVRVDADLLKLTTLRFDSGIASRVDVLQQQGQLADTRSRIPPAEAALRLFENRLDVLLGQAPDGVDRVTAEDPLPAMFKLPEIGVPSALLLSRPDLRARRAEAAAADAEVTRAVAERLPRLFLDGSLAGAAGSGRSGLVADLLGGLVQPIVDWGARRAEVEGAKALLYERLSLFTGAYLEAIAEVENALYEIEKQREFLAVLEERRGILEETVDETRRRYTAGLTDYLPVLDAVQDLHELEREQLTQARELVRSIVDLYVALGGGTLPEHAPNDTELIPRPGEGE